jgi:hypothetical protein
LELKEARSHDNAHVLTIDKGHKYLLDGSKVPGVTTFIKESLGDSPGLAWWRSEQTASFLNRWWSSLEEHPSPEQIVSATRLGCLAYLRALDEAGKIGTAVHKYVETYDLEGPSGAAAVKASLSGSLGAESALLLEKCLAAFEEYTAGRAECRLVQSEGVVASVRHRFAGTFDRLGERKGRLVLTDYKTSKGIYFSHFVQLGAYSLAIREWLGLKVGELEVLRFGKDGTFEPLTVTGRSAILRWERQALRCLETYRAIKAYSQPD